jgi:hypothetical protein
LVYKIGMVLYNITVNVAPAVESDWVGWMRQIHIPEVMATGKFYEYRFLKMLSEHPDAEGNTYAIQYLAKDMNDLDVYLSQMAPALQKKHTDRYGENCLAFRTVLEEI